MKDDGQKPGQGAPRLTARVVEDLLTQEVRRLDHRVQILSVVAAKGKDAYRLTLLKNGRTGHVEIDKALMKQHLAQGGKGHKLRKALGKAVTHLSIRYR